MKPILNAFLNGLKQLKNALGTRFSMAFKKTREINFKLKMVKNFIFFIIKQIIIKALL